MFVCQISKCIFLWEMETVGNPSLTKWLKILTSCKLRLFISLVTHFYHLLKLLVRNSESTDVSVYASLLVVVHTALLSFVLTPQVTIQTLKHEGWWPFQHFFGFCNGKTVITGNKITQTFSKVLILQLPLVTSSDSELFRLTISYI